MGRFDYPEPYAVKFARQSVLDSLMSHGEMCIAFSAYHAKDNPAAERCSCYDDIYKDKSSGARCTKCYNTTYTSFRDVSRMWALFTDSDNNEDQSKRGAVGTSNYNVQSEALPELTEGDYIARVSYWEGVTPLTIEDIVVVKSVTPESLRTGARYAQAYYDIVGQKITASRLDESHPIYSYDFGRRFDRYEVQSP